MSRLSRYRNPKEQMSKIHEYNLANYRSYTFRLHKEKDKELINILDNRSQSIASMIRDWFKRSKQKKKEL